MRYKISYYPKAGIAILAGLLISVSVFGQVNFSGTWSLNESKSKISEGGFRMVPHRIIIAQSGNTFTLDRFSGRDGRKITEIFTLDGKESRNNIFNTEKNSIATWSVDKKVLTISSNLIIDMNGQKNEIKTIEIYSLSDGNDLLTIDSRSSSPMGERRNILVFDRK